MSDQIEQLTEEERRWLESDPEFRKWDVRRKVLRIIDAHAADRAALVARVAELEEDTRAGEHRYKLELKRRVDAERNLADCRDELTSAGVAHRRDYDRLSNEATRLREALESEKREANAAFCLEVQLRQAAEARVAELEEQERNAGKLAVHHLERAMAAEQQLAAANALLARVQRWRPPADQDPSTYNRYQRENLQLTLDIEAHERAHLSAQLTAPAELDRNARVHNDESLFLEAQAALDTEHRLACEWKARFEAECAEHSVTKDRLTAHLARQEAKRGQ